MKKNQLETIITEKAETGINTGEMFTELERGQAKFQQQGTASAAEQAERAAKMKTQGRKGCKAVRINTAYTPENYQYVKVMSQITGQTMTRFINNILGEYRESHSDVYEKAKDVIAMVDDPAILGQE